jgi:hypothetical protein
LRIGLRGCPGGASLAQLLAKHRDVPIRNGPPQLSCQQILEWADSHFKQTGRWPWAHAGPVLHATGETWAALDAALRNGARGLHGGSSVAQLLAKRRGESRRAHAQTGK